MYLPDSSSATREDTERVEGMMRKRIETLEPNSNWMDIASASQGEHVDLEPRSIAGEWELTEVDPVRECVPDEAQGGRQEGPRVSVRQCDCGMVIRSHYEPSHTMWAPRWPTTRIMLSHVHRSFTKHLKARAVQLKGRGMHSRHARHTTPTQKRKRATYGWPCDSAVALAG